MLKEFFTGGPHVQAAKATISGLEARTSLNNRQLRTLEEARTVTRRHAIGLGFKGALALAAVGTGTVILRERSSGDQPQNEWGNLSSAQKIRFIEQHGLKPDAYEKPGFDPKKELATAVAQFYCQQTGCLTPPEEMAKNVLFLNEDQFIREFEKEEPKPLSPEEKQKLLNNRPEVTTKNRRVLINVPLFDQIIEGFRNNNSALVRELRGTDLSAKFYSTVLFHAYTHANASRRQWQIPNGFSLKIRNIGINFEEMEGFTFAGKKENGDPFFINGANEAITELTARLIGARATPYLSFANLYGGGMELVTQLNIKAGVTEAQFIRYNTDLPQEELFAKWGALKNPANPDIKSAILALASIGLYVDGIILFETAQKSIQDLLSVSLK